MSIKEVNIGSLGQVITGNTPPKKDPTNYGGDYPFIKPTDMTIGKRFVDEWDETYSEKAYEKYKKALIPSGATGVVTIGTVGEKIFQSNQHCFTNQSVNVVIPNENYDEDYVFYVLKLNLNKVLSANPGTSSGRHHVSKSNFCSITIDVVTSKKEQKKIASILSAYDDLIENNLKRIQLLEEAAQRLYKEWFVDFKFPNHENTPLNPETGLPEGWQLGSVDELVEVSSGYAFKSKDWVTSGNHVVKIKNLQNNTVNLSDTAFVNSDTALKASKFELFEGDILIAMTGATVGKIGLIPKIKKRLFLNQRVGLFRQLNEINNLPLIFSFFLGADAQKQVDNLAQGAAQPNISSKQIGSIKLHIPNENLLIEFNEKVDGFLKQIQLLNFQNQNLKEARDLLLPRLMNRTIEV